MADITKEKLEELVTEHTLQTMSDFNYGVTSESQLRGVIKSHVDYIIKLFEKYGETKNS